MKKTDTDPVQQLMLFKIIHFLHIIRFHPLLLSTLLLIFIFIFTNPSYLFPWTAFIQSTSDNCYYVYKAINMFILSLG